MAEHRDEPYFLEIGETLVGRRAGGGAADKAREARAADPLGTLAARILRRRTDERAWRRGAHGEMFVGWLLERLPDGWHVFQDVPVGERGANIDHLVIGPTGVFTVNTKNLTGTVWVGPRTLLHNGHRTDYLPKAAAEARRASRLLGAALGREVEVRGALAIIAEHWTVKERPSDIYVGPPRGLKRWLLAQPEILCEKDVIEIAGVAHKPATWTVPREVPASHRPPVSEAVPVRAEPGARCPCGGEMVLRTRRADGVPFLGCSRFPRCRRTWPLSDPHADGLDAS